MKKIASFNLKGGVGKSTLAVQLAAGLAMLDYKVLLVDLDSQNNCALFLGVFLDEDQKTFFDLIDYRYPAKFQECIINARENLDLLPISNYEIIEKDFHRESNVETLLDKHLAEAENLGYDYLLIDTAPSRGIINDSVLYYSDNLIVPVQLESASIQGISNVYRYLDDLGINDEKIKLIVPNMYDQRTNEAKENLQELTNIFEDNGLITEPIHRRTKVAEAASAGKSIYEYDEISQKQFFHIIERVVKEIA